MKRLFKKIVVPESNEVVEKEAVQLWVVSWISRHGACSYDIRTEFEAFENKQDALDFKQSLENAFKLLKHTHKTNVSINQN